MIGPPGWHVSLESLDKLAGEIETRVGLELKEIVNIG
jgi:hypothetical protein